MKRILLALLFTWLATSAEVGAGELHVIVAADAPIGHLSRRRLAKIYLKKIMIDNHGHRWTPVNLDAEHPLRDAFSQTLFRKHPEQMESYWNIQYFRGISPPHVVNSLRAMVRFVAETPGAIGYVPACALNPSVKVVLRLNVTAPTESACRTESDHPRTAGQ